MKKMPPDARGHFDRFEWDEGLRVLRSGGFSKRESWILLMESKYLPDVAAQVLVHFSDVWADVREADERGQRMWLEVLEADENAMPTEEFKKRRRTE